MLHEGTTRIIIERFFQVNRAVPPGLFEAVYQRALAFDLKQHGLQVETELPIQLLFRGHPVGDHRLDMVVQGSVLVECKRTPRLIPSHAQQVVHYLRATGLEVGLLLNFGSPPSFKRLVCTKHPDTLDLQFRRKG